MCGIAGLVHFDSRPADAECLRNITRRLAHRGPNGEGIYTRGPVGFGHRRLSIIDIEGGHQPMFNEDGSVAITYNGEIYNFCELRRILEVQGHVFRTLSDTEVVIHAWEQWGPACVERFRGMFAFAIADWNQRIVFLARDHLGIKPLYYRLNEVGLAFASEVQALRLLPDFDASLDYGALDQFLFLQYIPAPRTAFAGVSKLSPATRLSVSFDGRSTGPEPYWSLSFQAESGRSEAAWLEELEAVVRESVRAHLVADVDFGAFLSGGIDSSAVVGFMAETLGRPVRTFTIGFEEDSADETPYAAEVARRWGTDHHVEVVRPDALAVLPRLVAHHGEPFGDSSSIPTYYVSRLAAKHVPMVLSGDGGDEAFAGYRRYKHWYDHLHPDAPQRVWWRRAARSLASRLLPGRFPPDVRSRAPALADWMRLVQYITAPVRQRLWRPEFRQFVTDADPTLADAFARASRSDPVHLAQYIDYRSYLPNDVLPKVDVASMMHGLEVRTPLVDVNVVAFAARVPSSLNLARSADGGPRSKRLLASIVARQLSGSFVMRPKQGFILPVERWFLEGGPLRRTLIERISDPACLLAELCDTRVVRELIDEHGRVGRRDGALWLLLCLDLWLEQLKVCAS